MLNFHESWFLTLEFPGGVTQFNRIFKGKESFLLSRISKGAVTNLKDPGFFFEKSMSSTLLFGFLQNNLTIIIYVTVIVQILTDS